MKIRTVAVTGMGLITPLGESVEENWTGILAKRTGIGHEPVKDLPNSFQYLGKISKVNLPETIPSKLKSEMRFLNRGALLGFIAAHEAANQSQILKSEIEPARRALYVASGDFTKVGYEFLYPAFKGSVADSSQPIDHEHVNRCALDDVDPSFMLETLWNNSFSSLAGCFEFMGPNTSLASLSPCGSQALELAFRSIQQERADCAMAVGYGNWTNEIAVCELEELGLLSQCQYGPESFRPFNHTRDGFIPGEGGAALFLEDQETAEKRGAPILGRIRGYGDCMEGSRVPTLGVPPFVVRRSFRQCIEDAAYEIKDLGFINGHGSATRQGDQSELRSIAEAMNSENTSIPVSGMKPYTGHMGAASDLAEMIFGIKALNQGLIPATLNFNRTDKEFSDMRLSAEHRPCHQEAFLSISYGLFGQSSCVVISTP